MRFPRVIACMLLGFAICHVQAQAPAPAYESGKLRKLVKRAVDAKASSVMSTE